MGRNEIMRNFGKRRYTIGTAMLLAGGLALTGCANTETGGETLSAVVVEMQQADVGALTLQSSFVGTVSPQEVVYVIPFASGTITEVNYNVGDYVNAGDVLFRIDDSSARLQLEQAQLSLTNARQQVDMATGSQQSSTDLQLESSIVSAQSGFDQAQIGYVTAQRNYNDIADKISLIDRFGEAVKNNSVQDIASLQKEVVQLIGSSVSAGDLTNPQVVLAVAEGMLPTLRSSLDTAQDYLWQAESAYRAAETGLNIANQSKELTQGELRSDTNEQAQTSLALAKLGVESAELALSYYTVTAPISGVIQSRSVEVNGIAGSSSPAFTIGNETSMTVTFQVSEAVKNTLQTGDPVTVERGGVNYEGHITEVGVAVNQSTGLFQVKANVEVSDSSLPNGVSVKITADTYSEQNTIIIPYDAVYYDNTSAYVYLCVDGRAVKTYITTGIFDDDEIVVTDGIAKGDTVITSWSPRLLDGVEVVATSAAQE
ncbi:MAG: efflux RND transporter periplasmic adaptor subunit [Candidatus Gastranaerophilales bacterium]|nr:efflux RND transporter periplasmic adaptor subunit [Candidatus Gastranaerophilales bacterium]